MQPPAAPNQVSRGGEPSPPPCHPRPNRVALIGASVRAAAESARRGGFTVIAIDRFADEDTLAACQRHLCLDEQELHEFGSASPVWDAISQLGREVPVIPVGGLSGFRPWLDHLPLLSPWPVQREAAAKVRDLGYLRELASGSAFAVPASFSPGESPMVADRAHGGARWLSKRCDSSGGLGTRWADVRVAAAPNEVVQQWVAGRVLGATLLSNGSEIVLLGVCRGGFTRKGGYPFVYRGSVGPVVVAERVRHELLKLGQRISAASGLRGLFNVDFIAAPSGELWLLEVNPRWSGSSELIERHLQLRHPGVSLLSLMVSSLNGGSLLDEFPQVVAVAADDPIYVKRIVFARHDFRFDRNAIEPKLRVNETLHDIPPADRLISRGEPVCTLITQLDRNEKTPMLRHRGLVKQLSAVTASARVD